MKNINRFYIKIKPIIHTISFNLNLHAKIFIVFMGVIFFQLFLFSYFLYYLIPNNVLPRSIISFYDFNTGMLYFYLIFSTSTLFSGVICSEFRNKTGFAILPLISRNNLILGKYIANLILVIGLVAIYYLVMVLLGYNFYGEPIIFRVVISFGFCVLYIIAVSSIVTFLSSFMPSSASIIIVFWFFILFADRIIYITFVGITNIEPLYSLSYLFNIIPAILYPSFPEFRYSVVSTGNSSYTNWFFPNVGGALSILIIYAITFFVLVFPIFKRRK
ncbi:hypothetical protein LCGC14_0736620 [marine sediment metagenome]|uniref:ABC-2 type transporter domain-containing protein n=1 Tax=marine sediment metagenome TaxID=412755 RepID=A0A0F9QC58_9ZZZZ|nr:ABC transporter permease [archaeon]HEC38070.1 ABC transporter permease [bacterium]